MVCTHTSRVNYQQPVAIPVTVLVAKYHRLSWGAELFSGIPTASRILAHVIRGEVAFRY